jgi:SAM-dependent methyltransferase
VCNPSGIAFVQSHLASHEVRDGRVLEVGALDINGSVRSFVEDLGPESYIGVDIQRGPGVDEVCDVGDLCNRFGASSFDVVISTELAEHVRDWRRAFDNMKRVLRPGGTLVLTTRSRGFPIHGYPSDYWRYEPEDMRAIFADFEISLIERDPEAPGVFVKALRPTEHSTTAPLGRIALYSVAKNDRIHDLSDAADLLFRLRIVPRRLKRKGRAIRSRVAIRTRLRRLRAQ